MEPRRVDKPAVPAFHAQVRAIFILLDRVPVGTVAKRTNHSEATLFPLTGYGFTRAPGSNSPRSQRTKLFAWSI